MRGKPHRVPDDRIAEEIVALDEFMARHDTDPDRRMVCMALGARTALEWIRDSRKIDPMNPMRSIDLLMCVFDMPRVVSFKLPESK